MELHVYIGPSEIFDHYQDDRGYFIDLLRELAVIDTLVFCSTILWNMHNLANQFDEQNTTNLSSIIMLFH